jgi:hypothetical protein
MAAKSYKYHLFFYGLDSAPTEAQGPAYSFEGLIDFETRSGSQEIHLGHLTIYHDEGEELERDDESCSMDGSWFQTSELGNGFALNTQKHGVDHDIPAAQIRLLTSGSHLGGPNIAAGGFALIQRRARTGETKPLPYHTVARRGTEVA